MKTGSICAKHPELQGRRHNGGNCPSCVRERKRASKGHLETNRRWREANPEKYKAANKAWAVANPDRVRENNLRRLGFTIAIFNSMLKAQAGCCAVCGVRLNDLPPKQVHADHCHATKTPRGVLCHYCNSGLGLFKDNPTLLRAAADYLEVRSMV